MKYTPRQIEAWLEVMTRLEAEGKADRIDTAMYANADPKEAKKLLRKLREMV